MPCGSTCQKQNALAPVRTPYACVSDAVVRREVPRHHAIGHPAAPFEIAVAALPRVAEDEARVGQVAAPAEMHALDRDCGRRECDAKSAGPLGGCDGQACTARPASRGVVSEHHLGGYGLNEHTIRLANEVEKATRCGLGTDGAR